MHKPIFILGSGRCGSTLLQRLLNTYDNITIWGEHCGFLSQCAEAYFQLTESKNSKEFLFANKPMSNNGFTRFEAAAEAKHPEKWQAWMNHFSPMDVDQYFRQLIESFTRCEGMPTNHISGFKEIRYGVGDRVVEFLHQLYPQAHFVFLSRNGLDTVASKMGAFHGHARWNYYFPTFTFRKACKDWRDQTRQLLKWHESKKLSSYWVSFEDLTQVGPQLHNLLSSLGKTLGEDQKELLNMVEGRGTAFEKDDASAARWRRSQHW